MYINTHYNNNGITLLTKAFSSLKNCFSVHLKLKLQILFLLFICCFTSHSTARVILRRVVLQVEETSAYYTVNHRASPGNYQLSNMKRPTRDSNRRPQRLEAGTLTTTPPSPLEITKWSVIIFNIEYIENMILLKIWSVIIFNIEYIENMILLKILLPLFQFACFFLSIKLKTFIGKLLSIPKGRG